MIYSGIPSVTYSGILIFQWCKVAYYFELVHGVFEVLIRGHPYCAHTVFRSFWPHLPPAHKMTPLLLDRAIYCARHLCPRHASAICGNPSPSVLAHYMDGPLPCFQYSFHYIYSFHLQRLLRQLFLFLKQATTFKESIIACSVSSTLLLPARNTS